MPLTVEAIYENERCSSPAQPLPLKEREKVRLTVVSRETGVAEQSYGLTGGRATRRPSKRILAEAEEGEELP